MEAASDFLKLYIGKGVKFDVVEKNEIKFDDEIVLSNSKLNKVNLINKVKDLYIKGMPIRKICREVNISRNTVRKYINLENLENTYSITHIKKHDLYHNHILKLLKIRKTYNEIANELKIKGLNYSYSSIAKYCNAIKKKNNGEIKSIKSKRLLSRYIFFKYFWNPKKITTQKDKELLEESLVKYPHLVEIKVAIAGFSEVIKNKSVYLLDKWLKHHESSDIKQIKSFVNGVKKDYQSVKNCVIYRYNNGVLEGNVNRLKMIKRTMYGRASFHLLRKKVLFNI